MSESTTLDVSDLAVAYPGRGLRAKPIEVLHGVNLTIRAGETHGLVGESGSGKTTLGRAILGLAPVTRGTILLKGEPIRRKTVSDRRRLASRVQVVFQDPYSSLNPAMTVEQLLTEPLRAQGGTRDAASTRIHELLDRVHLPAESMRRYAYEFSGGQRQRLAIARALALGPELIVCDEPVSALDLTTQARILELLVEIQEDTGVSYLFISHDLAVVRHVSHDISVIYRGEIVEQDVAERVTTEPEHPYTRKLWMSSPLPDPDEQAVRRAERRRFLELEAHA
ncbi:ABC transporter ATP-binding protein [Pseudoclavibacter endophyticus]|uniref:ABC transporter ATP-binding protein n=1 Tax=Pseudoclavibacter endophyticus TaxID=1778590 RepID=A0A6H9WSV4_9MICO|nr:ATP-binding cassette domain-containing protein [Pseudoclavibacter endophyticus]KAB1649380.1 ABC transporter ATP-binding protein [Pseudoclavibacter endophyticus]GGA63084.1 ABC transporter ATP-binding protein [Pseudoclavibacter endophyticus]